MKNSTVSQTKSQWIFRLALLNFVLTVLTLQSFVLAKASMSSEDLKRKKEGWYLLGLPFANYNTDFGFGLGGGAYLFYTGNRLLADGTTNADFASYPYVARVGLQLYFTTLGQQKHFLNLDLPSLAQDHLSLWLEFSYIKNLSENYYGLGGSSSATNAPANFYKISREEPGLYARAQWKWPFGFLTELGSRLRYENPTSRNGSKLDDGSVVGTTLYDLQKPFGSQPAWLTSFNLGLLFDTRDFIPYPSKGFYLKTLVEWFPSGLNAYAFERYTFEGSAYLRPLAFLTLAARASLVDHRGDVPFYELAHFGGNSIARGYVDMRFNDRARILINLEVRTRFLKWKWGTESFDLAVIPFIDTGRVMSSVLSSDTFKTWRFSGGGELLLTWNLATHINLTFGFSEEGFSSALDTRILF
jgi:hypothetical protein